MSERYALFFAPAQGTTLELFGRQWLGRCADTGAFVPQIPIVSIPSERLHMLTRAPRQYGFHGTLVPPFALAEPFTQDDLVAHARSFAQGHPLFSVDRLSVQTIGAFLALVPDEPYKLAQLAEACLRAFHHFRKEPTLAELEMRRSKGLTARQQNLLMKWWYPYVLDEYRFHMTLTDSIPDARDRKKIMRTLSELTASICQTPQSVRELCIFHQPGRQSPFTIIHRIPLGI